MRGDFLRKGLTKLNNKQKIGISILILVTISTFFISYFYERDIIRAVAFVSPWVLVIRLYYENYKLKQKLKS